MKKKAKSSKPAKAEPAVMAVYVVLALLVIGTSFYTGYLTGQSSGGTTVRTGSEGVDKLTIVEYSDFQCPFCSRAAPTIGQLKAEYGDTVEIIYKHFPLESIHPDAFNAAVAAECVRENGDEDAFWTYHDTLFANQGALTAANLKQWARSQGVNIDTCFDNQETAAQVRADMAEGRQRGVSGTPSFWVHDELVVGAVPYSTLQAKVEEKLSGSAPVAPTPTPTVPSEPVDVAEGNYVMGDADAPILLVEFTDYQCPFCQRAHDQSFPQIKSAYIDTGKVRYTVRHFPLPIHPQAQKASEAAECAGKVGGGDAFWTYHDTLFANQGALQVADLKRYAADLGLDTSAFNACLDSGEFAQLVNDDVAAGSAAGVRGTPSFFVNGQNIVGAQPYSSFQAAFEAALS